MSEELYGARRINDGLLLPYQRAWNQETAPLAIGEKGRRIGLSWGEAAEDALLASKSQTDGGMNVYYVSYNKEMTEQFVSDVAWWASVYGLAASDLEQDEMVLENGDEKRAATVYRVRFESGHCVMGLPSHPRVLRSKQGKIVIDEAAFVDDLKELLKAAMAMLVWGGCVRIISTHNGDENPFNELIQDVRAGKHPGAVVHHIPFQEALAQGLYERICRRKHVEWTPEREAAFKSEIYALYGENASEELDCIPTSASGAYLTRNLIESCMDSAVSVVRWQPPSSDFVDWPLPTAFREVNDWCEACLAPLLKQLPKELFSYLGEDFGRTGDLTIIWPLLETEALSYQTPFTVELRNAPFRTQEQILSYVVDRLPFFCGGALDARGNGQALAEYARQRYGQPRIAEVMLSESWYRENMPKLKSQFEDKSLIIPKDSHVLEDLRAFQVVRGVARLTERRSKDESGQRHGDSGVAAALAVYAAKTFDHQSSRLEVVTSNFVGMSQAAHIMRGY